MSIRKKISGIITASMLAFVYAQNTLAADNFGSAGRLLKNTGKAAYGREAPNNFAERVGQLIGIALGLFGTIFFILVLYGGFKWMMARGDATESKKAKEIITDAVIGLIVVMAAYLISNFVVDKITGAVNSSAPVAPAL